MKVKQVIANIAVMVIAAVVGLVLCELGARLILNPADYLSASMQRDDILGIRIAPGSAGFDAWGFRNAAVPQTVDVVAIGDSHTFGNTAKMDEAWPQVVARRTGLTVYNLGVGGYGPNQYYHLLKTRGLSLHPKHVIVGLYLGDDFENAFSITYGREYWASLRTGQWGPVNADIWGDAEEPGRFKTVRNWLSRESMVYRLLVHGPVFGVIKNSLQFYMAGDAADPSVTSLEIPDKGIKEAFRPIRVAAGLDQKRPEVREGMRITFHLLAEMNRLCKENGCELSVVIIPTKETVFAEGLQASPGIHLKDTLQAVVVNERAARAELGAFLDQEGIRYVDALPALRRSSGDKLYYPGPADMHPGAKGYDVIGAQASELFGPPSSTAER